MGLFLFNKLIIFLNKDYLKLKRKAFHKANNQLKEKLMTLNFNLNSLNNCRISLPDSNAHGN